jgi:hypothetical protein
MGGCIRTASAAAMSDGRLTIRPKAPSGACSHSRMTVRAKFGSINCGIESRSAGASVTRPL